MGDAYAHWPADPGSQGVGADWPTDGQQDSVWRIPSAIRVRRDRELCQQMTHPSRPSLLDQLAQLRSELEGLRLKLPRTAQHIVPDFALNSYLLDVTDNAKSVEILTVAGHGRRAFPNV